MTWNIWARFGPRWQDRQPGIRQTLQRLDPDVVALQEVWASADGTQADELGDALGLHAVFGSPSYPPAPSDSGRDDQRGVDLGIAVLSRWPVLDQRVLHLPGDDGRLVLHARLDAPGHPIPLFTTHLTAAPGASAQRVAQVRALAGFVAEHRAGTAHPAVVTGDLNAWPDSDEVRLLGGYKTAPAVPDEVLLDAWEYADPDAPPATWDPANPFVADWNPAVRIDYVFVGPPAPDGAGRVLSVRRATGRPVEGVWPSDHYAVVADLA
jgi:endonuclease/exonuclease/phosphatase family metal-dependent hydrolase